MTAWYENTTTIDLDTVFSGITDGIYQLYQYMSNTYIEVAGYSFTMWNMIIGAMCIAFFTAACIPDTPAGDLGEDFWVPDYASEFYNDGYFDG